MIDFTEKIEAHKFVGEITIGENIDKYLDKISKKYLVEFSKYFLPDGEKRFAFNIANTIVIATLDNKEIISITCKENYFTF